MHCSQLWRKCYQHDPLDFIIVFVTAYYLHQPIMERVKAMVVRMAETKKQVPTQ